MLLLMNRRSADTGASEVDKIGFIVGSARPCEAGDRDCDVRVRSSQLTFRHGDRDFAADSAELPAQQDHLSVEIPYPAALVALGDLNFGIDQGTTTWSDEADPSARLS